MTDFVLLHGSFHAAWNWHKVLPALAQRGEHGTALDLPGHGLDPTPPSQVTLEQCVDRVTHALHALPEPVVLVAHSRNGIVISQAAERHPDRVLGLVYLAAYLVPNGKSMMDYAVLDRESLVARNVEPRLDARTFSRLRAVSRTAAGRKLLARALPERLRTHSLRRAAYRAALYHDCPDEITELANTLLEAEPTLPGFTPLCLSESRWGRVPKVYIECSEDRAVTPAVQRRMYQDSPCDRVFTLAASHSPFFSCPDRLVELLIESRDLFRAARAERSGQDAQPNAADGRRAHQPFRATINLEGTV
jgi:pimeloyl-ACP methyl ester carboxylesterase